MTSSSRPMKEAKGDITKGLNWLDLPREVTAKILDKLEVLEIFTSARLVCPLWWKICKDPLMWRTIDMTNHPHYSNSKLVKFSRFAIERSSGHLEDISIEDFGTDEILKYIADSGRHLRRMRLLNCWKITEKGLREAVKKLPMLEEFEISFKYLSKDTLELVGKCCPHLKVLKYNVLEDKDFKYDCDAITIAKTMPQLHHLQLLGNRLTNDGLVAILDRCPHLESLDLRVCSNVDLSGSLRERCCKQIRDLRFPEDVSEVSIYQDKQPDYDHYYECDCGCDCDWNNEANDGAYDEYAIADFYGLL